MKNLNLEIINEIDWVGRLNSIIIDILYANNGPIQETWFVELQGVRDKIETRAYEEMLKMMEIN